jgi:RHS repeat-associated protein
MYSAQDYYPFGSPMEGRTFTGNGYRFGFNGQEKEDDIYGEGNTYDLGLRMYDARLARMFSIDPRSFEYPWQSPYVYHRNSPIAVIDFMGGGNGDDEPEEENEQGNDENQTPTFEQDNTEVSFNHFENYYTLPEVYINEPTLRDRLKGRYNTWKTRVETAFEQFLNIIIDQKILSIIAEAFGAAGGEPANENKLTPRHEEKEEDEEKNKPKIQVKKDKDVQEDSDASKTARLIFVLQEKQFVELPTNTYHNGEAGDSLKETSDDRFIITKDNDTIR